MDKEYKTPLDRYLNETDQSYTAYAARIKKPVETVRRWALGISEPRKDERQLIEESTGGLVKFNPLYADYQKQEQAQVMSADSQGT